MSRVLDKIGSVEDALNQKLASFETQLLELRHLVPSPTDGVGEKFGVPLIIGENTSMVLTLV